MVYKFVLEKARQEGYALTFDDVRLKTSYSKIMPEEVCLESKFSNNVNLKIPIASAAMDTVTEYKLAIALAKLGGIGIIHRSLSIEEQAFNVSKVKHHLNGLIEKPICVYENEKIKDIIAKKGKKEYDFNTFPVLNKKNQLVGIVTGNDFDFCDDKNLLVKNIMSTNLITSGRNTSLDKAYDLMKQTKKKVLPLINEKKEIFGMYVFSDVKRIKTGSEETYNLDSKGRLRVAAAIGSGDEALNRVSGLVDENVDVVVIDTAHADTLSVINTLKKIKKNYPIDVVVGNVSVGESAQRLAKAGADGIKIGQGPGSICTTRIIAGIGRPQLSAIYDCAQAVSGYKVPICADGGLRNSGDIPIAISAGADTVMMGSMLAGTEESPGEIIFLEGRRWKSYRGMGSLGALQISHSSRERYLQEKNSKGKLIPEGVEGLIPFKGKLEEIIFQYIGGLKRGMSYVGAKNIPELKEKGDFDRITRSGFLESHPHEVKITKDSPNYKEIC